MLKAVLLTDGTGKDGSEGPSGETNVSLLQKYLAGNGVQGQYVHYQPGPGVGYGDTVEGGSNGLHLDRIIFSHYSWLVRCVQSLDIKDGAEFVVSLFGFSRGAFVSRILADLISRAGVPRNTTYVNTVIRLYLSRDFTGIERWRRKNKGLFLDIKILFLGLWDTVAASTEFEAAEYETVPENVHAVAHAVAINESRPMFDYLKIKLRDGITEEFFAGSHSDVGGGYGDGQVLSRITLNWIIDHAKANGVEFITFPEPVLDVEYQGAETHSEKFSLSNAGGALGDKTRIIDKERLNSSVSKLPWKVFDGKNQPIVSEDLKNVVAAYRADNIIPDDIA